MNYTINEIPDEATDANGADFAVMWQNNKTKKISILNLLKTLVKKSEVTNTVSATSNNVITSKGVSSLLTIPASNTTITNAPPLQNNATYRFFFTEQITGSDDTSAMSISYNGTSYSVKATSNGSLKDFTAYPIATEQTRNLAKGEKTEEEKGETKAETKGETKSGTRATVTTYVYCQAYTTLEMMFDGTQFIIMGNPVVISNSDYTVYTDGSFTYSINFFAPFEYYPTSLFPAGTTLDIVDFIDSYARQRNVAQMQVNLHCVWSYADSILLSFGNTGITLTTSGLQLIGSIGEKEKWRKYQFILMTDTNKIYKAMVEIGENANSPNVYIKELAFV